MKILVYPYDKNPYQKLLYKAMKARYGDRIHITYMWFLPYIGAFHIPLELAVRRLFGYRLIHIHWIAFYLRQKFPGHEKLSWYTTNLQFWWIKKLGYKIVWTVHDITPHQKETSDDIGISRKLANIADLKIVHSQFSIEQLKERGLSTDRISIIPHGNYEGVYKNTLSRNQARKSLDIPRDKFVILFFGIIKKYKGIDDLLKAYRAVRTENTILLIAGKCADPDLTETLQSAALEKDILVFDQYIPDTSVATYYQAADIVCLPFKAITTSGSILLALTFSKPVIAPASGALKELPKNIGRIYETKNESSLTHALQDLINNQDKLGAMSEAAKRFSDSISWESIADTTFAEYQSLLSKTLK